MFLLEILLILRGTNSFNRTIFDRFVEELLVIAFYVVLYRRICCVVESVMDCNL